MLFKCYEKLMSDLDQILNKENLTKDDLIFLLSLTDRDDIHKLKDKAYQTMLRYCGEEVYLRGLIEFSNICVNDCLYCGIRKSNSNVKRYTLNREEIIESAIWAKNQKYGSLVLQSGERYDSKFIDFVSDLVVDIKSSTISENLPQGLGITLCVGEQSYESYEKLYNSGAHRYLLRIESSNPVLYRSLHPEELSWDNRLRCLKDLKKIGFQVGTGVMIGFPDQTIEDLANDILFFKEMDIDMIGMGPFLIHNETPFADLEEIYKERKEEIYQLALKMIATTRLYLKDVNIASTTALQAMYPLGREAGLMYGANVFMPNVTPTDVRGEYQLYNGKPCIDEFASDCLDCVVRRIEATGRTIGFDIWGDSKHFRKQNHEL
jgi:biotin synthase